MLAKIKAWIGTLWGEVTTQILGLALLLSSALAIPQVQTALQGFWWFPYVGAGLAVLAMLARRTAPPPPSVPVTGAATMSPDGGTIMITPAGGVSDAVVEKAAALPDVKP